MKKEPAYEVCLVDDDEMYLLALKHNLEEADKTMKVNTFKTGQRCIEHLFIRKPDAVVLDYYLDDTGQSSLTGMHFLVRIKEIEAHLPVIVLSGQKDLAIAVNCIKLGASDYLVKNEESMSRLKQEIGNLISAKERRKKMKLYEAWNLITAGSLLVFLTSMVIYACRHT